MNAHPAPRGSRRQVVALCLPRQMDAEALAFILEQTVDEQGVPRPSLLICPAMSRLYELSSGIVVLDPEVLAQNSGPRIVHELVVRGHHVILLTGRAAPPIVKSLLLSGAQQSVELRDDLSPLLVLILRQLQGAHSHADVTAQVWASLTAPLNELTRREQQVVDLYCQDRQASIQRVANALGISPSTVKTHLANVRAKLGFPVSGNRLALRWALLRQGWIEP